MESFEGKVAVVTGAASGIGLAMAQRFAADGMKLVLSDIEEAALINVANTLRADGASVLAVRTDVSKADEVSALANAAASEFGKVHVVCNNAGVGHMCMLHEATTRDWEWVIGVNLWGVVYGVQTFLPLLMEHGEEAHIVNTASIAGIISGPGLGIYGVTKHAVVVLSETLYHEMKLLQTKVGVSVLCPGWVNTRICDSHRNRPGELVNDGEEMSPTAQMIDFQMRKVVADGHTPESIAQRVSDAMRTDQFYILTHDEMMPAVQKRMNAIINRTAPTFTPPPGFGGKSSAKS
ncbi:MAG TPA: SDR family NAD(P)-dependent oxidoreductase [Candidatus Hydrogenedentes bacterium]|nr:SDR family NAD(P)-dependent oxidoreductase [Candidatus Hydrogenedentota bacterium]HRK34115.1 SDR family NAD(P)-dependent oxidoreductase [Candidatus Hydrogenedentota bacterium]